MANEPLLAQTQLTQPRRLLIELTPLASGQYCTCTVTRDAHAVTVTQRFDCNLLFEQVQVAVANELRRVTTQLDDDMRRLRKMTKLQKENQL